MPIDNNPPEFCAAAAAEVTSNKTGQPTEEGETLHVASCVELNAGALFHVIPVPVHELSVTI
jgi:hypothetical protein